MTEIFEWNRLLYNDLPESFLLEVIFRSTIMFYRFTFKSSWKTWRESNYQFLKQSSLLL
jgi:hypothetical protein